MPRLRKKHAPAVEVRAPALFVECEWLVVALDAGLVERILLVNETTSRTIVQPPPSGSSAPIADHGLSLLDTGTSWVPAWDLDAMLGSEPGRGSTWIVVRTPGSWPFGSFGLRAGRCVCVRSMPKSTELPPGLVDLGAFRSVFATATIPELASYSTGIVLDPLRIPSQDQISQAAMELERA